MHTIVCICVCIIYIYLLHNYTHHCDNHLYRVNKTCARHHDEYFHIRCSFCICL